MAEDNGGAAAPVLVDQVTGEVIEVPKVGVKIAGKMLKVMAAIGPVAKDGQNTFHRYKYASDSAIFTAVRQALVDNGVHYSSTTLTREDGEYQGKNDTLQHTKLLIRTTFTDVESGESIYGDFYGDGSDSGDKSSYKALTGALKYALKAQFLIATEDGGDPDRDEEDRSRRASSTTRTSQARTPSSRDQRQTGRPAATARPDTGPPSDPPPSSLVCMCPCGCKTAVSAELGTYGVEHLGSPRCRECYPTDGFDFDRHRELDDLDLPKLGPISPTRAQQLADAAAARKASQAR